MEEDIKVLEHIIEEYKKLDIIHSSETPCNEIKAIQNLIAKNKELESNNYEANNIISDLLDTVKKQYKIIDLMSERLTTPIHSKEWVKRYYEEEVEEEE